MTQPIDQIPPVANPASQVTGQISPTSTDIYLISCCLYALDSLLAVSSVLLPPVLSGMNGPSSERAFNTSLSKIRADLRTVYNKFNPDAQMAPVDKTAVVPAPNNLGNISKKAIDDTIYNILEGFIVPITTLVDKVNSLVGVTGTEKDNNNPIKYLLKEISRGIKEYALHLDKIQMAFTGPEAPSTSQQNNPM